MSDPRRQGPTPEQAHRHAAALLRAAAEDAKQVLAASQGTSDGSDNWRMTATQTLTNINHAIYAASLVGIKRARSIEFRAEDYPDAATIEALREYFDELMRADWYYEKTDDFRVYTSGCIEMDRLERIARESDPHRKLWSTVKAYYDAPGMHAKPERP